MLEQEGEAEPAHHARRPMNAFLIFCKRHRSVVRDKYPNLENRSITKILGEWWANLDKEEKACYTGLAKQYKDAFFNANPDFKWYKLPAPPLRTLSSRPRENGKSSDAPDAELYHEHELEKTNNNSTKLDLNKKTAPALEEEKPLSMFTPGKLADEAQMGGISRLLDIKTDVHNYSYYAHPYTQISNEYRSRIEAIPRQDSIRELQDALSETSKVFEEDFDRNKERHRDFTNQDVIDQIVDKRYSSEDYRFSDDDKHRSGRTCKGKRYQEFMAVGGLIVNKRQKREGRDKTPEDGYSASCSWEVGSSRSDESTLDECKPSAAETTDTEPKHEPDADHNAHKTFKPADFDLDAKIAALPSLSLEKFQQKKRENKRKKKTINLKPKAFVSPAIDRREVVENYREAVIGSQKRKPRKVSITRFEINSLVVANEMNKASPEMKLATEAPCTMVQSMDPSEGDLMALATLAEVAVNTRKLLGTHQV